MGRLKCDKAQTPRDKLIDNKQTRVMLCDGVASSAVINGQCFIVNVCPTDWTGGW